MARCLARSWGATAPEEEAAEVKSRAAQRRIRRSQPIGRADAASGKSRQLGQSGAIVHGRQTVTTAPPRPQRSARRRAAVRLLAAGIGLAAGLSLLGLIWPEGDRAVRDEGPPTAAALGELPSRPIRVLLIGSDADRRGAVRNGAAPPGPANSDALLLVQVDPQGPLRVLSLPVEAAVQLPGDRKPVALGSLYRRGGPALVAGVTAELLDLPKGQPDRYVVLPRSALRELVDGLGRVELSTDRSMRYADRSQNYRIQLEGGLQVLNGRQVEQLLRFRDGSDGEERRRDRQQMAVESLLRQMGERQQLPQLPDLLSRLQPMVETNLTQSEALSLLATALQQGEAVQFSSLPLKPPLKPGDQLRQLQSRDQPSWPR